MARLNLDYQANQTALPLAGVALLGFALLVLTLVAIYYRGVMEQIGYWEAAVSQVVRAEGQRNSGSEREMREMAQEIKRANEVLGEITLPWDKLFKAVEGSSGKDIALLTIEPDAEKHEVKITGEAKNIAAVFNYIRQLAAQEPFRSVYLERHQVEEKAPLQPVRFSVIAAWSVAP